MQQLKKTIEELTGREFTQESNGYVMRFGMGGVSYRIRLTDIRVYFEVSVRRTGHARFDVYTQSDKAIKYLKAKLEIGHENEADAEKQKVRREERKRETMNAFYELNTYKFTKITYSTYKNSVICELHDGRLVVVKVKGGALIVRMKIGTYDFDIPLTSALTFFSFYPA